MFREIAVFQLWVISNFCTRELFRYISCFISVYLQEFSDEKYLPQDEIWLYDPECCTWYVPVCRYIINVYLSLLLVDIFYFSFIIQHVLLLLDIISIKFLCPLLYNCYGLKIPKY